MVAKIDMTGMRFGSWLVLQPTKNGMCLCVCDCGVEKAVNAGSIRVGDSRSCGCLSIKMARERMTTHGMTETAEYIAWGNMRRRCENEKDSHYKYYGARGIKVCERWQKFENFFADMGPRPDGKTLDRYNNDRDYEPGNCRWATAIQQARNKRNNHYIEHRGRSLLVSQWARSLGL